jgi:excisionase family DNA binding protein
VPGTCPPRLLDVQAAASYLSVSVWTIRDLVDAGELPRVRLSVGRSEVRRLLFDRRDLDRLVDRARGA